MNDITQQITGIHSLQFINAGIKNLGVVAASKELSKEAWVQLSSPMTLASIKRLAEGRRNKEIVYLTSRGFSFISNPKS